MQTELSKKQLYKSKVTSLSKLLNYTKESERNKIMKEPKSFLKQLFFKEIQRL